jgi:hypothetical protein
MGIQQTIDLAISDLRDAAMQNLIFGYERYLKTYFPSLAGEVIEDNLIVRNRRGHNIGIFQDSGNKFRVADRASLLAYGGGKPCDVSGLFDELMRLNSKM